MSTTTLTADIKTHVTPSMKSDFELLAVSRGVKAAVVQREAFANHIKANGRKLKRLRAKQQPAR